MTHKAFVLLSASGTPVALSTGVVLFNRKERRTGIEFHTRTYGQGGFNHPIWLPGMGPGVTGWKDSRYQGPGHPLTAVTLDNIDGGRPLDFGNLTTPHVFFTRDDRGGEFVLMDAYTRKLVRVSPLPEILQKGFWGGVASAYASLRDGKFEAGNLEEAWLPEGGAVALYNCGVYVCLNPAPYHEDRALVWAFDGPRAVLFDQHTPDGSPEQIWVGEEKLFGLAPYEV